MRKTNPLSIARIKKEADRVRKEFNAPLDSFFPIYEYIQNLYDNGKLDYQILDDDDSMFGENEYAKYDMDNNIIYVKDSVDAEANEDIGRARFTLSHELFHYIQAKVLNFKFEETEDKVEDYKNPEWQANEFAGQLLVPDEYIHLSHEEIMEKFLVSEECALYRKVKAKRRKEKQK